MGSRIRPAVLAAFAAIYFIWGSTYLGIRVVVGSLPPFLTAGTRATVAGAILYLWARHRGAQEPDRRQWLGGAVAGALLFGGGHGTLFWASRHVASGVAAVLESTIPIWVMLFSRLGPDRSFLDIRSAGGVVMGFAGIIWLNLPEGRSESLPGASLLVVAGAASWAWGTVWYRGDRRPRSASMAAAVPMLTGGLFLLSASLLAGEPARLSVAALSPKVLLALAYLILFGSLVAFSAYSWLLTRVSPTRVASYAYVNPVIALILGRFLGGEALTPETEGAVALILVAVILIVSGRPSGRKVRLGGRLRPADGGTLPGQPGWIAASVAARRSIRNWNQSEGRQS